MQTPAPTTGPAPADPPLTSGTGDDAPPEPAAPALGILVVHGIGSHKQGETLNEFATPIVKWLDRWLVPDERVRRLADGLARREPTKPLDGSAAFVRGTLRPPDLPPDVPAHARASIRVRDTAGHAPARRQSWLFAESWWSPQTLTPRVSPFLLWLVTRGPWLMLMHLSQSLGVDGAALHRELTQGERSGRVQWALVKWLGATLLWLALSLLLIALWCAVSLIALVPVGSLRRRVYAMLIEITGVVGDSYVLINDPIQRVAFAGSTRRALAWLRAQGCARVAVVAHSQGAAVARDVLLGEDAPPVDLLVTLGPGLAKLDALAARERSDPHSFMWSGAAAPLAFAALAAWLRLWADGEGGIGLWGVPGLLAVLAALAIARSWSSVCESLEALKPDALQAATMRKRQPRMQWADFYAGSDPVSNGSLSATLGANLARIVSRRVLVLGSVLQDHTSYWTSQADFVAHVADALDRCAGAGLGIDAPRVREGRAAFARSVRLLVALRWLVYAAWLLPLFAWDRLRDAAAALHRHLTGLPLASVRGAVEGIDGALGWAATALAGRDVDGAGVTAFALLGALLAVALAVWGRILTYWWFHMTALQLTPVFTPGRDDALTRFGRGCLTALVVALGLLPVVLSGAWTFAPEAASWESLRRVGAQFATLVFMMFYLLVLWALAVFARETWDEWRAARAAEPTWWRALRRVEGAWLLPLGVAVYGVGLGVLLAHNRYAGALWPTVLALAVAGLLLRAFARRRAGGVR
jgi:hypothetical protein